VKSIISNLIDHHQNLIEMYIRVNLKDDNDDVCGGSDDDYGDDGDNCCTKDLEGDSLDLFQCTYIGQTLKRDKKC
jgi:hypothetical protein